MLDFAPWAINGARTEAAVARRAQYAATSGEQGLARAGDLLVRALSTPGQGVTVEPGVGLILNRYQNNPNELYVASNPDLHTVAPDAMPTSSTSARSFMVVLAIGDPDFPQINHPFMLASDPPAGQELDFQYARIVLVQCSAGATSTGGGYPHLDLARIDIPANTTTITQSMITNVAKMARPRSDQRMFTWRVYSGLAKQYIPSRSDYADWNVANFAPTVTVPTWAKRAIIQTTVVSAHLDNGVMNVAGGVAVKLGDTMASASSFDFPLEGGAGHFVTNLIVGSEFDVTSQRGQTLPLKLQGFQSVPTSPTVSQLIYLGPGSQVVHDIRFFED